MKKILELGPEQFLSGLSTAGSQVQASGLFIRAEGVTVVRNPFLESDDVGILQGAPLPVDLTGSVIQDRPIAYTIDPLDANTGFGTLYFWGDEGWIYSVNLSGDNNPVNVNANLAIPESGQGPAANGLFIMNHSDGTKKLYYFREADIGFLSDLMTASPSLTTAEYTGLQTTKHHPTHKLFDRQYFGNGRYIGQAEDDGSGGLTLTLDALDLESDLTVTTIWDDGHYLVAGAASNPPTSGAGSNSHGTTKIIFWDTNSSSWDREWDIPDSTILAIRRVGQVMIAVTGRGLYQFTFDTPPDPILTFMNAGDAASSQYPSHFMADVVGKAVVWANAGGSLSSWGKFIPSLKNAYMKPFSGFGGADLTLVCANAQTTNLYVGASGNSLYRTSFAGGGGNLTDVSATTIYIDLKRWWQIGRVVVEFEGQLQANDQIAIDLLNETTGNIFLGGQASFGDVGGIRVSEMFCSLEARKLGLEVFFVNGSPRIRNIEVWGDPLTAPTHNIGDTGIPD